MSRAARVFLIAAAWTLPVVWVGVALTSGPSDGTVVSPPAMTTTTPGWGDGVTVVSGHGATPLRAGDVVLAVDGTRWGDWVTGGGAPTRSAGDAVTYVVLRPSDLAVELQVEVTLTEPAVGPQLAAAGGALGLGAVGLAVASALVWVRPGAAAHRALLAGVSLTCCGATTTPLGIRAIDVAGGRGLWPFLGGGILFAAGTCCLVTVAVLMVPTSSRARWPWVAVVGPPLAYVVWALAVAAPRSPGPYRTQALLTVAGPATVGATIAALLVLTLAQARAAHRQDRLAARSALLVLLAAVGLRLLLVDVPTRTLGQPLVPTDVVTALTVTGVLGGFVPSLLRYRLELVEPAVRRTVWQAALVTLVGVAFLAAVGVVDRASDRSFESMLAGGVIALLVLPLALGAQRWLRRRLYGDRDLPRQVVAELRRLDPADAPEQALHGTLRLLAERLHLSYVAIEVDGGRPEQRVEAAVGEPRGAPATVELLAGGTGFGRLLLEADPERDPFGTSDRRMLADVGAEVGALVQAVLLSTELQRSRQRLITTREEERRRLRRDLHDGLGPSLATMAMQLETARDLITDDPSAAAELVERLADRARDDIHEIRRLVDGMRPPALDQLGLVSALRQRAGEHGPPRPGGGVAPRWTVVAGDDVEPLPAAVEVAAYLIAVEAVNNALRHSGAAACEVRLARQDGLLVVQVRDDGRGLAEDAGVGVGLTSMRERAEELGGTCTVRSGHGPGTLVEARLPVGREGRA